MAKKKLSAWQRATQFAESVFKPGYSLPKDANEMREYIRNGYFVGFNAGRSRGRREATKKGIQ